ncbi:hypothetical protein BWI96_01270 [Siphonobacter sp. SORGH_AS_0500]|uniref:GNAT family N-acetyltransferase n=1 Tax=Siphonobacter sp. SORGH_AS_0500 TaxID=1864824 RepID=UPI000CC2D276|nr:GNAT family N-acetyltransferase [Siphonobacter sp. SORGH_AS_0500]PKK38433.1 hypothetical protein BWI96_01270 [Siphonobacter sp. SORGH_AS_0500]
MIYEVCAFANEHTDDLRQIYLKSRQQTFTWLDTANYALDDFDQATVDEVILVAVCEGQSIGFISWYAPANFVHHLFIDSAYTNRGIGKELLSHCLARMGRPAQLKCLEQNVNALAFYQSQGWQIQEQGESEEGSYFLLSLA